MGVSVDAEIGNIERLVSMYGGYTVQHQGRTPAARWAPQHEGDAELPTEDVFQFLTEERCGMPPGKSISLQTWAGSCRRGLCRLPLSKTT